MIETGQGVTDAKTITEAFEAMSADSEFVFNDRTKPLVVLNREPERGRTFARIRGQQNATTHMFLWGDNYDRPRHKPLKTQTNYVEKLRVIEYASDTQQTSLR